MDNVKYEVGDAWDYRAHGDTEDTGARYVINKIKDGNVGVTIFDKTGRSKIKHITYSKSTVDLAMSKHKLEGKYDPKTTLLIQEVFTTPKGIEYKMGDIVNAGSGYSYRLIPNVNYARGPEYVFGIQATKDDKLQYHFDYGHEKVSNYLDNGKWKIEGQTTKKSNDMKEVIEVGDIVQVEGFPNSPKYTVEEVRGNKLLVKGNPNWDNTTNYVLIEKSKKKEVIGYELLKDLPGIPKGTKSQISAALDYKFGGDIQGATVYYSKDKLQDTTWFKPLYKPEVVEVVVSGKRTVRLENKELQMAGVGLITFDDFFRIYDHYWGNLKKLVVGKRLWETTVDQIQIGCQLFTKEDAMLIHKEISNLK